MSIINHDRYKTSNLANAAGFIPMVDSDIRQMNHITTPEWMIQIDDLLSSTIEKFEKFSELYGWSAEQGRLTKGHTSNNLFSTAAVQHSNVRIVLSAGIFIPTLDTKMNTGANISLIKIVRLANVGDMKVSLQEIEYKNCKIESMEQQLDHLIISFRPETRQNKIIKYKQDGSKEGQAVSKFDYTKGTGE